MVSSRFGIITDTFFAKILVILRLTCQKDLVCQEREAEKWRKKGTHIDIDLWYLYAQQNEMNCKHGSLHENSPEATESWNTLLCMYALSTHLAPVCCLWHVRWRTVGQWKYSMHSSGIGIILAANTAQGSYFTVNQAGCIRFQTMYSLTVFGSFLSSPV